MWWALMLAQESKVTEEHMLKDRKPRKAKNVVN
jgi:hypothetical protein